MTAASVVKLPETVPPVMLNVPVVYTPAPSSSDELPETVPPDRVNTPLYTYTPPPYLALLPETLPPSMRNVPSAMYTPPPFSAALLPEMLPPYMVKVPSEPRYTPVPVSPSAWVILPVPLQSLRVKLRLPVRLIVLAPSLLQMMS